MNALAARPLVGTERASSLFWSPDGENVGFIAEGKLKRVAIAGGTPVVLCDVPTSGGVSGTWGRDSILFATINDDVIYRVSVARRRRPAISSRWTATSRH